MRLASAWRWIWSQPWLVLGYMAFVSGANGVAARIATNEVPPICLVFLRWFIVCTTLAALLTRAQRRELAGLVRRRWRRLGWMSLLGYAGFNSLFYIAAYHTSAVNLTLLQSAIPALVLAGAALVLGLPVKPLQIFGMIVTFCGVVLVTTKGDPSRLSNFRLDLGDGLVLLACLFFACYTLGLRSRPAGTPVVFFAGMAAMSLAVSVPLGAAEIASGHAFWPSTTGWFAALFIAFGPSFTGQLCYMRGVDLIGPARAGLYANLIPIFGALCAVLVLHETFTVAHAIALALGLGGISLAEYSGRPLRMRGATPGDARLPETDERRHDELHDEGEQHGAAGDADEHGADQAKQAAERDDHGQEPHARRSDLDLRDGLPKGEPDADEQSGEITHVAVEGETARDLPGHGATEHGPGESAADGDEAGDRDRDLQQMAFRRRR